MPIRAGCVKLSSVASGHSLTQAWPRDVAVNRLRFEDWGSRESEEAARARDSGPGQHKGSLTNNMNTIYIGDSKGVNVCLILFSKFRGFVIWLVSTSASHLRMGSGLKWAAEEEDGALVRVEPCWSPCVMLWHRVRVRVVSWSGPVTTDI